MTREDLQSVLEKCQLSMAARGQLDGHLPPHLWERFRQRLQAIYRTATGEQMAVLSIDNAPAIAAPVDSLPVAKAIADAFHAGWMARETEYGKSKDGLKDALSFYLSGGADDPAGTS